MSVHSDGLLASLLPPAERLEPDQYPYRGIAMEGMLADRSV